MMSFNEFGIVRKELKSHRFDFAFLVEPKKKMMFIGSQFEFITPGPKCIRQPDLGRQPGPGVKNKPGA